jgi:hypothetical protein
MILLGTKNYTVTRPGAVDYADTGHAEEAAGSTFTVAMSIQEAKQNDLARIKDIRLAGKDIKGCVRIYTTTELRENDTFTYAGYSYKVVDILPRDNDMGLDHYKCFAIVDN